MAKINLMQAYKQNARLENEKKELINGCKVMSLCLLISLMFNVFQALEYDFLWTIAKQDIKRTWNCIGFVYKHKNYKIGTEKLSYTIVNENDLPPVPQVKEF
jgi:hypothetical protein